jgi:uncharacterized protein YgfB (UPF0149 family)
LGLQKVSTTDADVLEMIKDFSEISKLDGDVLDGEQNAQDLSEIIEFVRMGTFYNLSVQFIGGTSPCGGSFVCLHATKLY